MPPTADFRTPDALAKQSFDVLQLQQSAAYRIMAVLKDARAIRTSELCERRGGRRQVTHISSSKTVLFFFAVPIPTRVKGLILPTSTRQYSRPWPT